MNIWWEAAWVENHREVGLSCAVYGNNPSVPVPFGSKEPVILSFIGVGLVTALDYAQMWSGLVDGKGVCRDEVPSRDDTGSKVRSLDASVCDVSAKA